MFHFEEKHKNRALIYLKLNQLLISCKNKLEKAGSEKHESSTHCSYGKML